MIRLDRIRRGLADWIDGLDRFFSRNSIKSGRQEAEFDQRLKRLRKAWDDDRRALAEADFAYWSNRFERLRIADIVGCTFNLYLNDPVLIEAIRESALKDRGTLTPETTLTENTPTS